MAYVAYVDNRFYNIDGLGMYRYIDIIYILVGVPGVAQAKMYKIILNAKEICVEIMHAYTRTQCTWESFEASW